MFRKLVILGLVLAICMATIPGVLATEGNRGNHQAIWKADPHQDFQDFGPIESGRDWGAMISSIANDMNGVSEGVHDAKNQPVPGQNK